MKQSKKLFRSKREKSREWQQPVGGVPRVKRVQPSSTPWGKTMCKGGIVDSSREKKNFGPGERREGLKKKESWKKFLNEEKKKKKLFLKLRVGKVPARGGYQKG